MSKADLQRGYRPRPAVPYHFARIRLNTESVPHEPVLQILHYYSHPHPLYLGDWNLFQPCIKCNKKVWKPDPFYSCLDCGYHLHKSCAEEPLPQEIEHPFHPDHRLTLVNVTPPSTIRCSFCDQVRSTEKYFHCDECHLYLCTICLPLKNRIKYKSHPHLLRFVQSLPPGIFCNAYDSICKSLPLPKEFSFTQGYGFQCVECNFKIHLLCGPLPCTIKHESHVDCLTLEDSIIEDDDPDDEYYCNTCEELRDPRVCVYYCSECKFIAHVHCVMSEVGHLLKGELQDVDLRVVGELMTVKEMLQNEASVNSELAKGKNKGPSVREMINSLNEVEKEELEKCFDPLGRKIGEIVRTSTENQHDGSNNRTQEYSSYIEEDFKALKERLVLCNPDPDKQWKFVEYERDDSINVEGYMIPRELAPFLKLLFAKYGDISRESMLKHKVKSILLSCLCWSVSRMRKTKVIGLSEDTLALWWCNLRAVQRAGFQVEFIMDRLNKVTLAYFALAAREQERQITSTIGALSAEIMIRKQKIEEWELILETYNMHAVKSSLMKECQREAAKMKWRFAGENIL